MRKPVIEVLNQVNVRFVPKVVQGCTKSILLSYECASKVLKFLV